MNDGITCPDCNSQDVQKIEKKLTVTTDKRGPGCLVISVLIVFFPVGIIYLIYKLLHKPKDDTKIETEIYYVCRSCGREFRKD